MMGVHVLAGGAPPSRWRLDPARRPTAADAGKVVSWWQPSVGPNGGHDHRIQLREHGIETNTRANAITTASFTASAACIDGREHRGLDQSA